MELLNAAKDGSPDEGEFDRLRAEQAGIMVPLEPPGSPLERYERAG
jgi:hypothetical protein